MQSKRWTAIGLSWNQCSLRGRKRYNAPRYLPQNCFQIGSVWCLMIRSRATKFWNTLKERHICHLNGTGLPSGIRFIWKMIPNPPAAIPMQAMQKECKFIELPQAHISHTDVMCIYWSPTSQRKSPVYRMRCHPVYLDLPSDFLQSYRFPIQNKIHCISPIIPTKQK